MALSDSETCARTRLWNPSKHSEPAEAGILMKVKSVYGTQEAKL